MTSYQRKGKKYSKITYKVNCRYYSEKNAVDRLDRQ